MPARIAIVTTVEMPLPDPDEELLLPLLPEAALVAWDDADVDWASFDVVVLRSTWNYAAHLDEFLAWATRVSQVARLLNPIAIVEWNTDKRYLADLASRGIPVVPTQFFAPGEPVSADAVAGHVVVKPTVGAGSRGAALFRDDAAGALSHAAGLQSAGYAVMVQPYLADVDEHGETALVFIGGAFSHAVRKAALLSREMSWSTGLYADEKLLASTAPDAELELAHRVLADLPGLAYARVDLLPTADGPVVLELELTEPSLFLALGAGAPARAAAAFRALLP